MDQTDNTPGVMAWLLDLGIIITAIYRTMQMRTMMIALLHDYHMMMQMMTMMKRQLKHDHMTSHLKIQL